MAGGGLDAAHGRSAAVEDTPQCSALACVAESRSTAVGGNIADIRGACARLTERSLRRQANAAAVRIRSHEVTDVRTRTEAGHLAVHTRTTLPCGVELLEHNE